MAPNNAVEALKNYKSPDTQYFKTQEELHIAVGEDFIRFANKVGNVGDKCLVGLSHGQSPAGAYAYILANYNKIKKPYLIRYTFVNSPFKRQRDLKDVMDAKAFLKALVGKGLLERENILGSNLKRADLKGYTEEFNERLKVYLEKNKKTGLDYVFLATTPQGHVAGISRHSETFKSDRIVELVSDRGEEEVTGTPQFLKKSRRIAFIVTKQEKRRALAYLFYRNAKPDESPSFLRFIDKVEKRMTVFVDDDAMNWPQVAIVRQTQHGPTTIRVDLAKPYNENAKKKLPVILLIHGFLGLNSYDGILTLMPTHKYIAAAMHYGSVPDALPVERYSKHVVNNIDAVVAHFGEKGHPVYIYDHSMGNIYFLMINRDYDRLKGIQQYLKGRIGANPFFGIESKHAMIGFLDNVIIPSLTMRKNTIEKSLMVSFRRIVPLDSKKGVRKRGIRLTELLIKKDSERRDRLWHSMRQRIIHLMTKMDSLPALNRIPIERALNRLPAKIFVIQIHAGLLESETFDNQIGLTNMEKHNIPVLILKSERDSIAKFVPRFYNDGITEVKDVTNLRETDLFREHLYHMVNPQITIDIIDRFIKKSLN